MQIKKIEIPVNCSQPTLIVYLQDCRGGCMTLCTLRDDFTYSSFFTTGDCKSYFSNLWLNSRRVVKLVTFLEVAGNWQVFLKALYI